MQSGKKTQKLVPIPAPGAAIQLARIEEFVEIGKRMIDGVLTFEENADYVQAVLEKKAPIPPAEPIPPEPCETGPGEPDREREALMRKLAAIPDPRTFQTVIHMLECAIDASARGGRSITDAAQAASAATVVEPCSRGYNAAYLRTPMGAERGCAMKEQCVAKFHVGRCFREFLTPSQENFFRDKGRREDAETHPCLICCRDIMMKERLFERFTGAPMMNAIVNPQLFCNLFNTQDEYVIADAMQISESYPVPVTMNKWRAYTIVEERERQVIWIVETGYATKSPSF